MKYPWQDEDFEGSPGYQNMVNGKKMDTEIAKKKKKKRKLKIVPKTGMLGKAAAALQKRKELLEKY